MLDAQPAMDLVQYAQPVLVSGEYKASEDGLSGCIERVVFKLPEEGAQNED